MPPPPTSPMADAHRQAVEAMRSTLTSLLVTLNTLAAANSTEDDFYSNQGFLCSSIAFAKADLAIVE